MENLSWNGQPLEQVLDESPNSDHVFLIVKALVQAQRHVRVTELRLQLERLIQGQYVEYKRTFNAEILKLLLSSELATKLFHKLGGVGIVLYGYIHHKEGLEVRVLELDDEDLEVLIGTMGKFLKVEKENRNPGILGIELWLSFHHVNACSGTLLCFIVQYYLTDSFKMYYQKISGTTRTSERHFKMRKGDSSVKNDMNHNPASWKVSMEVQIGFRKIRTFDLHCSQTRHGHIKTQSYCNMHRLFTMHQLISHRIYHMLRSNRYWYVPMLYLELIFIDK